MSDQQPIRQLEKRKGGYYYLIIPAEEVQQLSRQRATRLIVDIDQKVQLRCGLNHLGDGNFFVIIASRYLKQLQKNLGDTVHFEVSEDPNPLGVDMPEVLSVLLEQDQDAKATFEQLTDGKKRSLIFSIQKIKDVDRQVKKAMDFLEAV